MKIITGIIRVKQLCSSNMMQIKRWCPLTPQRNGVILYLNIGMSQRLAWWASVNHVKLLCAIASHRDYWQANLVWKLRRHASD